MNLLQGEIHVWLAFDQEFSEDSLLEGLSLLLEPVERELAARKRAKDLPRQHVVTRALQRLALSKYASAVAPGDWRFTTSEHGKPSLAPDFDRHDLHFNVAHTSRLVAIALARHCVLGVDVESVNRRAPIAVAPRYFTEDEARSLSALAEDDQYRRFFSLWTLKESWLKATGEGLAGGLGNVSFEFADATRAKGVRMRDGTEASWRFWQATPSAEHLLALAVRSAAPVDRVRLFRWRPGLDLIGDELEAPKPIK